MTAPHPSPLILPADLLLAIGNNRRCYYHPDDRNLCIKVVHPDIGEKVNNREKKYYQLLQKRGISWERLARYQGAVATDQGEGLVFDVVRDYDGRIAKTVDHYLKLEDTQINDDIVRQIEALKAYFLRESIVFSDLTTLNMVMRRTAPDTRQLMIIDGLGHNDAIPLCDFIPAIATKKIKRMWNRKRAHWFDNYPQIKGRVLNYD